MCSVSFLWNKESKQDFLLGEKNLIYLFFSPESFLFPVFFISSFIIPFTDDMFSFHFSFLDLVILSSSSLMSCIFLIVDANDYCIVWSSLFHYGITILIIFILVLSLLHVWCVRSWLVQEQIRRLYSSRLRDKIHWRENVSSGFPGHFYKDIE